MQISTTVKAAFLVHNTIGKEARLIASEDETKRYLGVQRVLKKALEPQLKSLEEISKEKESIVEKYRKQQRNLNLSSSKPEEKDQEMRKIMSEMETELEPMKERIKGMNDQAVDDKVELVFDQNDFAWLKSHIEKNAVVLTRLQDPENPSNASMNDEALEILMDFVTNSK